MLILYHHSGIVKIQREARDKMTFAIYTDAEGYIGDMSAPDRETAVRFLTEQGHEPGTYELREIQD